MKSLSSGHSAKEFKRVIRICAHKTYRNITTTILTAKKRKNPSSNVKEFFFFLLFSRARGNKVTIHTLKNKSKRSATLEGERERVTRHVTSSLRLRLAIGVITPSLINTRSRHQLWNTSRHECSFFYTPNSGISIFIDLTSHLFSVLQLSLTILFLAIFRSKIMYFLIDVFLQSANCRWRPQLSSSLYTGS